MSVALHSSTVIEQSVIYLVDDHPGIRRSIQWMLESRGFHVHACASAEQFLQEFDPGSFSCILVDFNLGSGMNGLELQQRLRADDVRQPIFFISDCSSVPVAVQALKEGATDFIVKPIDDGIFSRLLHGLDEYSQLLRKTERMADLTSRWEGLTAREKDVAARVANSLSSRAIAEDLQLASKTIDTYRQGAMRKLGVRSIVELARAFWTLFPNERR